ncbi:nucleotidyltransferase domain-containing protein [Geomonas nitrogeniifigens]|uniref:Nucleotidyltransferase domain-containing protein n=1 Tax=Geomonas diazotrophica TaxID=2843197 RepID=A0ABX8JKQ5_9BACT|nr:GSU2403 family nucleotidyltransferase fold protein [Geomonas nitrogeniifigens]QWV98960.1 nucleotidyltransferase domain-containing protein [Geomonas nitrogeniifigens]QXE88109.1 nucleotidyltransferase domain-containing protein [Geomonas nitrogeniifigens]
MEIVLDRNPFPPQVSDLLKELCRIGFFPHGLLIGSWPMLIYTLHFTLPYGFATNDVDFAVHGAVKIPSASVREEIPELLERLGYEPITDYDTGIETFVQGTFEVEFIGHRRGGGSKPAAVVHPWKVSAQLLPFIDLLFIRPCTAKIEDFLITIPSPETFFLHKLLVARRRSGSDKEWKRAKDLQQCRALSEVVREEEIRRILGEYRMSKGVKKDVVDSCADIGFTPPVWPER